MSGTVSIANDLFANATNTYAATQITNDQNDFSQFMNQNSSNNQNIVNEKQTTSKDITNEKNTVKSTGSETTKTHDKFKKLSETNREDATQDISALTNEVAEQVEALKIEIANALGVSLEEMDQIMTSLGLTDVDLLNVENLTLLITTISNEDAFGLLTNEDLYATFQELTEMVSDVKNGLMEEFGITEKDLNVVLEQMKQLSRDVVSLEKEVVTEDDGDGLLQTTSDSTQEIQIDNQQQSSNFSDNSNQEDAAPKGDETQMVGFMSQVEQRLDTVLSNNETIMSTGTSEEILKQLVEYIKVNVDSTVTEMEIQLQPASLGTVNVQVVLQDGQLTAQFKAETEMAKTAIESQMVQLRDTLQEQGLKIQAIEVTVATHEFERELDQREPNQEQDGRENSGKRRVNLNLGELDELGEDVLSEEEQIAVEMMIENGNTVDYTA